jgi:hypothetical protein
MVQWAKIAMRNSTKTRLAVGVLLATSLAVSAAGCDNGPRVAEYPPREPTPGKAELPAAPNLDPEVAPSQYPDSAWSVRGVLAADKKSLPEWLSVRGYVASLAACPVTERVCKPAPHLYLSDSKEGLGKRLLVGGERDLSLRGWKVGDQITAEGKFVTASADGVYYAPAGLLLLRPMVVQDPTATVDATGKPTAPPAPKSK